MRVMVLAGGPDRERPVSFKSGAAVEAALAAAGHDVRRRDIGPNDRAALDEFVAWPGDVLFPVLHGPWGEGGPLHRLLRERRLPAVGPAVAAAERCMDKAETKRRLRAAEVPTPAFEVAPPAGPWALDPPVALKPPAEGSSIDTHLCPDEGSRLRALDALRGRHDRVLAERLIAGREVTVGFVGGGPDGTTALPALEIRARAGFYDYAAKYERDDTEYRFDIPVAPETHAAIAAVARAAHAALEAGPVCRIDLIVDREGTPWVLEANTMPGFTDHSLLPMAAREAGIEMPALVDRLARSAAAAAAAG